MTRIHGEIDRFVEDALDGLVLAHQGELQRVDGGVIRRHPLAPGQVAVVIGGGSGHYPSFAGLVGLGLAAGAVCGNIFTSPSAGQAFRVAQAVETGGGVLFSYGNYAGDVIHFGEAERRLRENGVDARTVLVTDDVASAPQSEAQRRRGIAGDLVVFRIAGAAAERGDSLDEVERLARIANDRTRTLGVAFSGCTLPGGGEPLFTVPEGMMSVGLGIHGEPGIRDVPLQSAPQLARTLLEPLLEERPVAAGSRVAVIVNGLGTVKYEELFVLFRYVAQELDAAGLEIVEPECGELVTSLDMAGVSLTLCWLDAELEELWHAPAYTPAYRKGAMAVGPDVRPLVTPSSLEEPPAPNGSRSVSEGSADAAAHALRLLAAARSEIEDQVEELGRLDAVAGDGDHGIGMLRGLTAASDAAQAAGARAGLATVLEEAGEAWSERAGGTSGALWGAALRSLGASFGDADAYGENDLVAALVAARDRIVELGGARVGDKTMVDAIVPFSDTFADAVARGVPVPAALRSAADAASSAAEATASLSPKLGRARPLAERSVGHPDPGAISFAIIVRAVAAETHAASSTVRARGEAGIV
ncbi:dihydroxyacetone kinase family protein [Agromyces sp. NPDC049794]|uniref:dihydroxyacetone kinase family protein n=1 Tax=unclassified Agromyces TaxID=2639701 RepID=UPI0033F12371